MPDFHKKKIIIIHDMLKLNIKFHETLCINFGVTHDIKIFVTGTQTVERQRYFNHG